MTKISTINPATDTKIADYDVMTSEQAFEKVEQCQAAFWIGEQKAMLSARLIYATSPTPCVTMRMRLRHS